MKLQYATISYLCANASAIPCYVNLPLSGGSFHLNMSNIAPERYEFLLSNCDFEEIDLQISLLFLNSGGEHLSTHERPLLFIRALFIIFWALLMVAWGAQWALSDVRPPPLHHVLSTVPVLKLLALCASVWSWVHMSKHGSVADYIVVCNYLFTFLFNVAFYSSILLVSRGWTITVLTVPSQELRAYGVTVLGLALSSLFYELLGHYYFFALLIMGVIYLRFALANVQTNVYDLKAALRIIRQHPGTTLELLLRAKTAAMKMFNRLLVGYAFGMGGALVLITFFFGSVSWIDSNKDWLILLLLECLLFVFFAGTCWVFRLRRIVPVQQPGAPTPLKNVRSLSAQCMLLTGGTERRGPCSGGRGAAVQQAGYVTCSSRRCGGFVSRLIAQPTCT